MFRKKLIETSIVNATGDTYIRVEICTGQIETSEVLVQNKNSTIAQVRVRGGYKVRYYENDDVVALWCERIRDSKRIIDCEFQKDENGCVDMHRIVKKLSFITGLCYDYYTSLWCEAWNNRGEKLVA